MIKPLIIKKKIRSIYYLLSRILNQEFFFPYKSSNKNDLLLFDNIYPHPMSGFRIEEFTVLLSEFPKSKIILFPSAYQYVNTPVSEHKQHIDILIAKNHSLLNKLRIKRGFININTKLFYCVFLNNIYNNLHWLEKHQIPFIFTLYPGGGFQINNEIIDKKLKIVLRSTMFRKVIVNQEFTKDYLINKNFCKHDDIEFIFGCVVPQISLKNDLTKKKSYLINKDTFDICFSAVKYTTKGEDKGYDVFIDFAHQIASEYDFVKFHVIGGFTENEIDISLIKEKIQFYGYKEFQDLGAIYKNMDVIVSPNKPFVLSNGAFDGFPLGTVIEACFNGVVPLITDELKQNNIFIKNEDLIIIESNSASIKNEISSLIECPEKLYFISKRAREKFIKVYSNNMQMEPRIQLLMKEIEKN